MPELPEVETVRRGLAPVMEGAHILQADIRRPDLRFPFPDSFATALEGQTITALGRRAKYLIFYLDSGMAVISHLGMSGSFRIDDENPLFPGDFHFERSKDSKHDHVVLHLEQSDGSKTRIIYNDPRRFGFMLMTDQNRLDEHPALRSLGIEPTGNSLDGERLASLFKGRKAPLKSALLDQRLIAGLGNIYVCEALWRARVSPSRQAATLVTEGDRATKDAQRLAMAIRDVIAEAIAAGGSSLRDYTHADGSLGYFQHSFAVYGKEGKTCPNPDCGQTIKRISQSGRSTFYCDACQC